MADKFLAARVIGDEWERYLSIETISPSRKGLDTFDVRCDGKLIYLRGNCTISVVSGLKFYLEKYCHHSFSLDAFDSLSFSKALPKTRRSGKSTLYNYRYYLNYCIFNYSMSWWDWHRWDKEIDWMALNGINVPLSIGGSEYVWRGTFRCLGLADSSYSSYFSGPAYLAWNRMGNMDGWGGPLPSTWIDEQYKLQKKILKRQRQLGMKPVLSAFSGHIPKALVDKYVQSQIFKSRWNTEFDSVYFLSPTDPLFQKVGSTFMAVQQEIYGDPDHLYATDTFNENPPPAGDSGFLGKVASAVYKVMEDHNENAKWLMQGWMFYYDSAYWTPSRTKELLSAVPKGIQ